MENFDIKNSKYYSYRSARMAVSGMVNERFVSKVNGKEFSKPFNISLLILNGNKGESDKGSKEIILKYIEAFFKIRSVAINAVASSNVDLLNEINNKLGGKLDRYLDYNEMLKNNFANAIFIFSFDKNIDEFSILEICLKRGFNVFLDSIKINSLSKLDDISKVAKYKGLKLGVSNIVRSNYNLLNLYSRKDQILGEIIRINLFCKSGLEESLKSKGENLFLSGILFFDFLRWFVGEPSFCMANFFEKDKPILFDDSVFSDKIGCRVLPGCFFAQFQMDSGIPVSYFNNEFDEFYGIEIMTSKGKIKIDFKDNFNVFKLEKHSNKSNLERYVEIEYLDTVDSVETDDSKKDLILDIENFLESIDKNKDPKNSICNFRKSLEMIYGILQSSIYLKRVYFPLTNRVNPLEND